MRFKVAETYSTQHQKLVERGLFLSPKLPYLVSMLVCKHQLTILLNALQFYHWPNEFYLIL